MKSVPGTYALIFASSVSRDIRVGRRGSVRIQPGFYVYVGSAFGPGGVRARVGRHFRKSKCKHWHIDYLRAAVDPVCVWCSYAHDRLEHDWARAFSELDGVSGIKRFGCSDCRCDSHLFAMSKAPASARLFPLLGGAPESHDYRPQR